MANMMDYLDWRGDLSFRESGFNEVDNLILANVSYIELEGIVPGVGQKSAVTVREAANAYFMQHTEEEVENGTSFIHLMPFLLKKMGESRRYGDAILSNYVNVIDLNKQQQFSAMHITLDDKTTYVSFAGTDDTLVGWQEDFNLSFQVVPSQIAAVDYVEKTTRGFTRKYRFGGHSKGGNLAIYAAAKCSKWVKRRILAIYNNDGPGFTEEMMKDPQYHETIEKVHYFVPEATIIGVLLEHQGKYKIVGSSQKGIMQHDALSWEVLGTHFAERHERTVESVMFEDTFKEWLRGLDDERKKIFIAELFDSIRATGAENLSEIGGSGLKGGIALLKSLSKMGDENKAVINKLLSTFTNEYNKKVVLPILERIVPQVSGKNKKEE